MQKKQSSMKDLINQLTETNQRRFAIWCARRCKTEIPEINAYIDAIEGYYITGGITKEQLRAADSAAYRAADLAANRAADRAADRAAHWEADCAAYRAAYWAAYWAAYSAAHWVADRAKDRAKERKAQLRKILDMIKRQEA